MKQLTSRAMKSKNSVESCFGSSRELHVLSEKDEEYYKIIQEADGRKKTYFEVFDQIY
jgi:hypothetical protein